MGIEPASAPGDAGQSSAAERRREVHARTDRAMAWLDQGESVSAGNQLGKRAGSCLSQFVVDLVTSCWRERRRVLRSFARNCCRRWHFTGVISSAIYLLIFLPNTHLLGEAVALFFLGTLYPQMPGSARWKESGWKIVLHEAGGRCVPTAFISSNRCTTTFMRSTSFCMRACWRREMKSRFHRHMTMWWRRMLDVVAALAQAGPAEGFGDDDGGRLFNPRRNRTEQMTDPLALGAVMYDRRICRGRS